MKLAKNCAGIAFIIGIAIPTTSKSQDYSNLLDQDGIHISGDVLECNYTKGNDEDVLVLSIKNNSSSTKHVHFHLDMSYNDECATCEDYNGEYTRDYILEPGQTIKGGCETDFRGLNVFYGWAKSNKKLLTGLELSQIDIRTDGVDKVEGPMNPPVDPQENPEAYAKWKKEWIKNHPEEYEKLKNPAEDEGKHVISKSEFDQLPEEKKQHIRNNPDLYVIK